MTKFEMLMLVETCGAGSTEPCDTCCLDMLFKACCRGAGSGAILGEVDVEPEAEVTKGSFVLSPSVCELIFGGMVMGVVEFIAATT